jgi:GH24 family phage-related lysozyme (muramidase)
MSDSDGISVGSDGQVTITITHGNGSAPGVSVGNGGGTVHNTQGNANITANIKSSSIDTGDLYQYIDDLAFFEGVRPAMYADSKGNVTVGIGTLLANVDAALALPFFASREESRGHGDYATVFFAASKDLITINYNSVKSQQTPGNIVLCDQEIADLAVSHIEADENSLKGIYSDYKNLPLQVSVALHDMVYTLGATRLKEQFPKFNDAINRKDWATAATESHRIDVGDVRNQATYDKLMNPTYK